MYKTLFNIAVVFLFLGSIAAGLEGCTKRTTTDETTSWDLSKDLKDCKIYRVLDKSGMDSIQVIRCPNSSTTTETSEYQPATKSTVVHDITVIDQTPSN